MPNKIENAYKLPKNIYDDALTQKNGGQNYTTMFFGEEQIIWKSPKKY